MAEPGSIEALFEKLDQFAVRNVCDVDQAPPTFFLIDAAGASTIIVAPWEGEEDKGLMVSHLRRLIAERGIISYGAILEVWTAAQTADPEVNRLAPMDRQDRREAVSIIAVERGGGAMHGLREIIRSSDGQRSLGEIERGGEATGTMLSLFEAA